MNYIIALLAAVVFAAAPALAAQTETLAIRSQHAFREHGTAKLEQRGPNLVIDLNVTGMRPSDPPQFVHIHHGTCEHLGAPTNYELEPIRAGHSKTVLRGVNLRTLGQGTYSLAIHQTLAHVSMHIACAGPIGKEQ